MYKRQASNGELYSVIDTELIANSRLVIDYLKEHYSLIVPANEATLEYCFKMCIRDRYMAWGTNGGQKC